MKTFSIFIFIFILTNDVTAQKPGKETLKLPMQKFKSFKDIPQPQLDSLLKKIRSGNRIVGFPSARYSHRSLNGASIYLLSPDNMPCVVPDMKQFNMPNYGKNLPAYGMPPAGKPFKKIIPDTEK